MVTTAGKRLREGFKGQVLETGDPGYDEARQVFNAMIDRRPSAIAQCADVDDVVRAVTLARNEELIVAVRSGGHSVVGMSVCDGGLVIDLSGLKSIEVDATRRVARAGSGLLWGEFDNATQKFGLHTPGGRITSTGLGGFTVGGGYGWSSSVYGLASDNLISAQVVLADGRVVTASENQHADLFWGIRGGGCNFGIVTEFEFRLHPLGPDILAGLLLWPAVEAQRVLYGYRDIIRDAPDELSTTCEILTVNPDPAIPDHLWDTPCVGITAMWIGGVEEGEPSMQALRGLRPEVDLIRRTTYLDFQAILDPANPPGLRNYWGVEYLSELSGAAIETFIELAREPLTSRDQLVLIPLGQAGLTKVAENATAMSHRDAAWMFHPILLWSDAEDDTQMIAHGRRCCASMRPFSTGATYLNFSSDADKLRAAYGDGKFRRLVALKEIYDPGNLFRHNHNIAPEGQALR